MNPSGKGSAVAQDAYGTDNRGTADPHVRMRYGFALRILAPVPRSIRPTSTMATPDIRRASTRSRALHQLAADNVRSLLAPSTPSPARTRESRSRCRT
jgi:hypothetical protein